MTMSEKAEQVRAQAQHYAGRGRGSRYPKQFQSAAAECVRELQRTGLSRAAAARRLGLEDQTVARWLRESAAKPPRTGFLPVVASAPAPARFVLHGPRGLRVEGLDLESLAELLRRLA